MKDVGQECAKTSYSFKAGVHNLPWGTVACSLQPRFMWLWIH